MPYIASLGTYLPCWGSQRSRVPGDDEDAVTLAVEAGRCAVAGEPVERVVLVSRDLPLVESSNAAVLLAGLGLDPELEVIERLGGAPAALDALSSARPRTLVIGADLEPAGAAAAWVSDRDGLQVRTAARVTRSLPVRTRNALGAVHDYGDPRLLHERGLVASLSAAWLDTPVAVAGVEHKQAAALCLGSPPRLPTLGASAGLFALAAMADWAAAGLLVGVEQANLSGIMVVPGAVRVRRTEPPARAVPEVVSLPGADLPISLAAYERAFEAKVRWEAGRHGDGAELDFPPRYRVGRDGTLSTGYTLVPLPRTGSVYAETTVRIPVPGLKSPYSLVIVELDDVGVRALAKVTGADPGTVSIGDRGRMVLRRVAVRSGVPDYGYAFEPEPEAA
ncbi:OB-fold domain-containing protein [Nocardia implantans]|uniref:OB-fold domain-containing protein n=1 Tax=Nocardia implantans TaxID=3108168 RepID=A0ABU6AV72_9NOCA|nr:MULTISPECIES: OB-fold domain-containing protein [unclassified Nocardia]MBF6192413.1 OB-fold domain-containing protein [Nocardia beijingensis]MEA3527684.1 OB-fold domain-containing protein [Nocardia sp. CDC192]MEB3511392.1 OB-fold domain-containing protein [Nocardia sp. CDC186]